MDRDEPIKAYVDSIGLGCKAFCAYYAAEVYLKQGRYVDANALYRKANVVCEQAIDLHKERSSKFTDITTQQSASTNLEKLNALSNKIVGQTSVGKGKSIPVQGWKQTRPTQMQQTVTKLYLKDKVNLTVAL